MTVDDAWGRPAAEPLRDLRATLALFSLPGDAVRVRLQVGGFMVSGRAVPRSTWLRALAGRLRPTETPGDCTAEQAVDDGLVTSMHDGADEADFAADLDGTSLRADQVVSVYLLDAEVDPLVGEEMATFAAYEVPLSGVQGWSLDDRADPRVEPGAVRLRPSHGPGAQA